MYLDFFFLFKMKNQVKWLHFGFAQHVYKSFINKKSKRNNVLIKLAFETSKKF